MDTAEDSAPPPPPLLPAHPCGLQFLEPLQGLLEKLHALYPDPKRTLHYDQYLLLLLLACYEPALQSLRALQQASTLPELRKRLGLAQTSLGSLSEAAHNFNPEYLREIFLQLAAQTPACHGVSLPAGLPLHLWYLAVDGTLWSLLPRMAREFYLQGPRPGRPPGFKAHVQFDILRGVPVDAQLTEGYASERRVLEASLRPHAFYLIDAGYIDFVLFQRILDICSDFLIPARPDTVYRVEEERTVTPAAQEAGVLRDEIVRLGSAPHAGKLKQSLRVIHARVVQPPPHNLCPTRRQGKHLPTPRGEVRWVEVTLITSDLQTAPELLVQLYRYRWQIELFFRWLKCVLGCQHFISESENGFALQLYASLIATLLVVLCTGLRPSKRLQELMHFYLLGLLPWEELQLRLAAFRAKQKKG